MFEPVPKFRTICDHYKGRILAGHLAPGDPMPSVREVAATWKCAQATAARAMRELQSEGYAYTVGQTTLVADRRQAKVTMRIPVHGAPFKGDIMPAPSPRDAIAHPPVGERVTGYGLVTPPAYVLPLLGLPSGSQVTRVEAVDDHDGRPIKLTVRWYAPEHADLLEIHAASSPRPAGWALLRWRIEERTGRTFTAGVDSFHARLADDREARLLRIAVGVPVMARVTTWADRDGVGEYTEQVYPPGVVVSMEYLDALSDLDDPDSN